MPRIRYIKPDFFDDEDLTVLTHTARIFFIGLWCYADRNGVLENRPKYLKAKLFPYEEINVEKLLVSLEDPEIEAKPDKKFIELFVVEGRKYIKILNFLKHQKPHPKEKELFPDISAVKKNDQTGKGTAEPGK